LTTATTSLVRDLPAATTGDRLSRPPNPRLEACGDYDSISLDSPLDGRDLRQVEVDERRPVIELRAQFAVLRHRQVALRLQHEEVR
jgi:hypothetical protein